MSAGSFGRAALVLVATPIGNLGDLSPRARDELSSADVIACEDTRRTGKLLELVGLSSGGRLEVVNDHTEAERAGELVGRIVEGARVVLVSDAGMPVVADPGHALVRAAIEAGVRVEVVPGPSAAVTALVASGLPANRWVFEGFLPRKGGDRARRLAEISTERRTVVLYEAPHRVARSVGDLCEACGPTRRVALARELTKLHEDVWRGTLGEAVDLEELDRPRGEYVIVVDGAEPVEVDDDAIRRALEQARGGGASTRDAVSAVAADLDVPRKRVYAIALDR